MLQITGKKSKFLNRQETVSIHNLNNSQSLSAFLYTLEFLGTWELINNPGFKVVEFDHFKSQAGVPSFVLSVSEWIDKTNAIGIIVRKGKYGGTYAHKDIAFK